MVQKYDWINLTTLVPSYILFDNTKNVDWVIDHNSPNSSLHIKEILVKVFAQKKIQHRSGNVRRRDSTKCSPQLMKLFVEQFYLQETFEQLIQKCAAADRRVETEHSQFLLQPELIKLCNCVFKLGYPANLFLVHVTLD